jgi:outer membrane protein assembly complex protein YaeT
LSRILLSILALILWCTIDAAADDIGGVYRGVRVDDVRFEGLERRLVGPLKSGLALTAREGVLGRHGIRYDPALMTEDLDRIRLYLARNGYPLATVSGDVIAEEDDTEVDIVFEIEPGPVVRIRSLEFEAVGESRPLTENQERELGIAVGEPYSDLAAERARLAVLEYLRRQGYARAKVELEVAAVDSTGVSVGFNADRGRQYDFGETIVKGVPDSFDPVVTRAANIQPGDRYDPRTERDATEDVRALRLFRKVEVSLVEADSNRLDFALDLSEREHRSVEFGVGYLTDDGPIATAGWEHRNLFGGGRGFRVFGSVSQYEQLLESAVIFPALFHSPTTGTAAVAYERNVEPAYTDSKMKTSLLFTYRHSRRTHITTGPLLEIIKVTETADDPDVPEEIATADGPVASYLLGWNYDSSDDPLFPSRGMHLSWDHQIAPPGIGSITKFWRTRASAAVYRKVAPHTIFAARVYSGLGVPMWGSNDLIISYRHFAGGSNSHRGYKREELGPTDPEGNPQGGELSLLGGAELRFPFWKFLQGSLFLDAGQVWFRRQELSLSDLSYAWGPGLALKTPVGPIRFDYGVRIDPPDDGRPKRVFHFAVGYAF